MKGKNKKKRTAGERVENEEGTMTTLTTTAATAITATAAAAATAAAKQTEIQTSYSLPRKKFFRQRAHANPFSDHALEYPASPDRMNWSLFYPAFATIKEKEDNNNNLSITKQVEIADIGCGFGGLLFALSTRMPETLILGLEIRTSVSEFVQRKIQAMRSSTISQAIQTSDNTQTITSQETSSESKIANAPSQTGPYQNIAVLRANTMKFLPNIFRKSQLRAIFLAFPDPHFKSKKHKARIVSSTLTAEYAYVLRPSGIVYTITDVQDLHEWMARYFDESALFERVGDEEIEKDELAQCMRVETEEGKKVERNGGEKFLACWRRLANPPWPES